ncbi:MAG: MoaD/ThiS family protein [Myxococcales bacterium]|nr:MoaD/ThiS family protein [Myxococcales bacterium]MCA9698476.1 MoaD/ThiS family protein [Myxococcales bacterium]
MATVELTRHLYTFFPALEGRELRVDATTVAEALQALEQLAPGSSFYICDERGRLRRHVNIFVDGELLRDRNTLADPVGPDTNIMIMQALSGG